ncbi:hypothetical protein FRC08_012732, partial [Ceratobasidium sp. 394]
VITTKQVSATMHSSAGHTKKQKNLSKNHEPEDELNVGWLPLSARMEDWNDAIQ